jgi:hypothetical protein
VTTSNVGVRARVGIIVDANDGLTVAPYGQEDVPELKSVFEWSHLKDNAAFLDTQCKPLLPPQV